MSTATTEIEKNLSDKQLEANRKLHLGIKSYNIAVISDALAEGAQVETPVVFKNGTLSNYPPLGNAVYLHNANAVRALIRKGVNTKILLDGVPLFSKAVQLGETEIVTALLLHDKQNINTYTKQTSLSIAILSIPTFSLLYHNTAVWSSNSSETDEVIHKKLQNWYLNQTEIDPNLTFSVKYKGNIAMINILLGHGNIGLNAENADNVTPLMIAQNPKNHVERFLIANGGHGITFLREEDNVLFFQRTIPNVDRKKKLTINLEYDLKDVCAKVQSFVTEHSVVRRVAQEEKTSEEIENLKKKVTPMYDAHTISTTREKTIEAYRKKIAISVQNPKGINPLGAFFDQFAIGLNATLLAIKTLYSGRVVREHYSIADKIADATSKLSSLLPFGTAGEVISTIIQMASDYVEAGKAEEIVNRIEMDHTNFCKDLAIAIITKHTFTLSTLNPETARKMAEKTIETVVDRLGDKTPFPVELPLVQQLMPLLNDTNAFKQTCQEIATNLATKKKLTKACALM